MRQKTYQQGPNIGKPIECYPACLYNASGATRIVHNVADHLDAAKDGWHSPHGDPEPEDVEPAVNMDDEAAGGKIPVPKETLLGKAKKALRGK